KKERALTVTANSYRNMRHRRTGGGKVAGRIADKLYVKVRFVNRSIRDCRLMADLSPHLHLATLHTITEEHGKFHLHTDHDDTLDNVANDFGSFYRIFACIL